MVNTDYNKLYALIFEVTNQQVTEADDSFRLEEDLGIYGDEAVDFITRYAEMFQVDVSEFPVYEYFNLETDSVSLFFRKLLGFLKKKKTLTIFDLKKGIINKKINE
ncbi:DUF1493 family protein [Capnocytophaga canimorsus]|uniref:DUF1493 family protein n=1 Tax=Capnocytophaga canimorsus TaxID=28188 RepID=UPI0028E542BA|nr:DUF1493 family protein [Capnocytophaga canimorsus]MDT9498690.1 DUF1493 family protein [Capnocytophaga canimorsus]